VVLHCGLSSEEQQRRIKTGLLTTKNNKEKKAFWSPSRKDHSGAI
jgi:hypothetical protein